MPATHSFQDVTPFARFDAIAWTVVRVEEAAVIGGAYTERQVISIPVDPTPQTPNPVDITVTLATLAAGYFRFRFDTAVSNASPYTSPVLSPGGGSGPDYFTLDELRAMPDLALRSDEELEAMRALAQSSIEDACGVAFVPRAKTVSRRAHGTVLRPGPPRLLSVASVIGVDGAIDLTDVTIAGGLLVMPDGWPTDELTVTVEHGHDAPPLRVKSATMILAREWLLKGPISERRTQLPTESGGSINLATPGLLGSTFGIPEVDYVVKAYREDPPAFGTGLV